MKIQSVTFQGSGEKLGRSSLAKKSYTTGDGVDVVYEPGLSLVFVTNGADVIAKHVSLCDRLDLTPGQMQGLIGELRKGGK